MAEPAGVHGPQLSGQKRLPPFPPPPQFPSALPLKLGSCDLFLFVKLEVLRKELKIPQGKPGKMVMGLWPLRWLCFFLSEADGKKE